jgi:hypothetical protein
MGIYLNPGKELFQRAVRSEIYIDKTGLIAFANAVIGSEDQFICVSRPRRFGKSMAANMLAAYYDRTICSADLFADFEIAADPSYETRRNKYDVIFLNIQGFLGGTGSVSGMIGLMKDLLLQDFKEHYPDIAVDGTYSLPIILEKYYNVTKTPFVFVIDEWDCIFREFQKKEAMQRAYLDFLRDMLKDRKYVALAYMTGILPIRKYGTHSALNIFTEYSMTNQHQLARFAGFTQEEVSALCSKYEMGFDETEAWYNGYLFKEKISIRNPRSVSQAMRNHSYGGYWTKTETYEALKFYIDMNYDGLRDRVTALLAGDRIRINTDRFTNTMTEFGSCEDVLTLLIHLGYLGYDSEAGEAFIPNREVQNEFVNAINGPSYKDTLRAVEASGGLLKAIWSHDGAAVAAGIESAHQETSHLTYNNENALSYTLSLALFAACEYYTVFRELPSGKGFADLVFLPRAFHPEKPALAVELKWDKSAAGAIAQIKEKKYFDALKDYKGNMLLVGVSYDKSTRKHECVIEPFDV